AMVEVRRDFLGDYEIEQYPDRTVAVDGKDAKSWGLRAGGELLLEPYRFGEKGNGSGLGILVGAYWVMDTNPATREGGKDSVEVSAGLLWTFE
ncbi:MAG: hypothetical protein HY542_02955, partial [Deltaproteobacteria bacterium]|nr:hypothetical protein [Deltaproteobacteria bacterium]